MFSATTIARALTLAAAASVGAVTPATAIAASVTAITVGPARPAINQSFRVTVSGVADDPFQLVSASIKRTGGPGCAPIPGDDAGIGLTWDAGGSGNIFTGNAGTYSITANSISEDQAGTYLLCAWIEADYVSATVASTQITFQVGSPVVSRDPCSAELQREAAAAVGLKRARALERQHHSSAHRRSVAADRRRLAGAVAALKTCRR